MLKNDDERLEKIIDSFGETPGCEKINYKDMLEEIREFNYDIETNTARHGPKKGVSSNTESEYSEPVEPDRPSLTILDIQKVPYNKEEEIKNRSNKVNRMLKKHFKTRDALTGHLKRNIDVDKNGTIDLNEFQTLIISTLK